MQVRICSIALILLLSASGLSAQRADKYVDFSNHFIGYLTSANYEKATEMFSEEIKSQMGELQLADLWEKLEHTYGKFSDTGETFVKQHNEKHIVFTRMKFEKLPLFLKLVFNEHLIISGIFFEPADRNDAYKKPPYADYTRIKELKTTIQNGKFELPAALTLPRGIGPFPVVILVHGSGPQDMDESIGPNKPFKDLALGLATQGIAVFRYDKRTKIYGGEIAKGKYTIHDEVTDDALAAIQLARSFNEIDTTNIYLLGHSLGGMMAPEIARRSGKLKGVVLMAAPARSLFTLLDIQMKVILEKYKQANDTANVKIVEEFISAVQLAQSDELSVNTPQGKLPFDIPAEYWMSIKEYNQVNVASRLNCRMLIMHAEKDKQVFMDDFEKWKEDLAGKKKVDFQLFEELNHMFLPCKNEDMGTDYEIQGNVTKEVIDKLARWVLQGSWPVD